jgi:hypothetical protein
MRTRPIMVNGYRRSESKTDASATAFSDPRVAWAAVARGRDAEATGP